MKKSLAAVVAVAIAASFTVAATATSAVECDGKYPYFHDLAQTEEEQAARIACLEDRRDVHQEAISKLRAENADYTERIQVLKRAKEANKRRIAVRKEKLEPLTRAKRILAYVVGDVLWVYSTAFCESGGTMQHDIHNSTGKYHSFGQFDLPTAREASIFEGKDPHLFHAIEIAHGMVEVKRETSDERWPRCGD